MGLSRKKIGRRDVFDVRSPGGKTVNLRRPFRMRHPWATAGAVTVLVAVILFAMPKFFTRAEVSDFYPAICLGDWQNPANAEGLPETAQATGIPFTPENSAMDNGSGTQIFCGGFVPPSTPSSSELTNVSISFIWQIGDGTVASSTDDAASSSSAVSEPVATSTTATSTSATTTPTTTPTSLRFPLKLFSSFFFPQALADDEDTSSDSVATTDATTDAPADAVTGTPPDAAPDAATPAATAPSSSVPVPAPTDTATDTTAAPASSSAPTDIATPTTTDTSPPAPASTSIATPTPVPVPAPASTTDEGATSATSSPSSTVVLGPPIVANLVTVSDTLSTGTSSLIAVTPPAPDDNFLSVSYSTDGVTWIDFAKVSAANWPQFTVTVPVTNWTDLENLQIRVQEIPTTQSPVPPVYLDGMLLEVHSDVPPPIALPGIGQPSAPDSASQTTSASSSVVVLPDGSVTPAPSNPNGNFSADESPAFDVDFNSLPAAATTTVAAPATTATTTDTMPLPSPPQDSSNTASSTSFLGPARQLLSFFFGVTGVDRLVAYAQDVPQSGALPTQANPVIAEIFDPGGNLTSFQPVTLVTADSLHVALTDPGRSFRPGKYDLKLWFWRDGTVYYTESDFTWGVLAVNFDKSIYTLGDTATVAFGVLDDGGNTICGADVAMSVTSPSGAVTHFSTADGTIQRNATCGPETVTDQPDYSATLPADEVGTYSVTVAATTLNGTRQVTDSFQVQDPPLFDVERTAPTRIFPPSLYRVSLVVTANADYAGEVTEEVPASFTVTNEGGSWISSAGDGQTIGWQVNMKKGDTVTLSYLFLAPNVSPQLYRLGPLAIGTWHEARQWQIAADAGDTVIFITTVGSTTWTVPGDWNSASNTIEVIGAGGGGRTGSNAGSGGGAGGGYSKIADLSLTPGSSVAIQIGSSTAAGVTGGDTFVSTSTSNTTCAKSAVCAKGGPAATSATGATATATSSAVGTVRWRGGNGGTGNTTGDEAGGGGGAAGSGGNGGAGGGGYANNPGSGGGGGGAGGPSGAGGAGVTATTTVQAGAGGTNDLGAAGGAGATGSGASAVAGMNGAGGGGGAASTTAGAFRAGAAGGAGRAVWTQNPGGAQAGAGGGGGGSGGYQSNTTNQNGGGGGNYGGGGGGGKNAGGTGAQGIIVITYTPLTNVGPTVSNVVLNGGNAITLTPLTSTTITVTASTTAGSNPIISASAVIFRSGVTAGCSANNLNCYQIASSGCMFSGSTTTVSCSANIWYFAQATDASSSYASQNWRGTILVADSAAATGTATTATGVELNTLSAIGVAPQSVTSPISLSQSVSSSADYSSSAYPSVSATFPSNTSSGDAIVVFLRHDTGSGQTVTGCRDSVNATSSYALAARANNTGNSQESELWYAQNIAGGTTPTVTCTFNTNTPYDSIAIQEYRGIATTSALDATSTNIVTSASTALTTGTSTTHF
ncbi:MAG TPA: hypothetical protein VMT81_01330, partial [Candidatus Paceibacterota bacterium]|nr:hypothetical protein [Candidatus Paceibacterota bacterium]